MVWENYYYFWKIMGTHIFLILYQLLVWRNRGKVEEILLFEQMNPKFKRSYLFNYLSNPNVLGTVGKVLMRTFRLNPRYFPISSKIEPFLNKSSSKWSIFINLVWVDFYYFWKMIGTHIWTFLAEENHFTFFIWIKLNFGSLPLNEKCLEKWVKKDE